MTIQREKSQRVENRFSDELELQNLLNENQGRARD